MFPSIAATIVHRPNSKQARCWDDDDVPIAFPGDLHRPYGFPPGARARLAVAMIRSRTAVEHIRLVAFDQTAHALLQAPPDE
jgi:hypothetical protein